MAKKSATKKVWPGTKPTQIRFTDTDKAMIEKLQKWFGLPSTSATIRHCLQRVEKDERKNFPKNSDVDA